MLKAERRDPISDFVVSSLDKTEDQQKPAACDLMTNEVNNTVSNICQLSIQLSFFYTRMFNETIGNIYFLIISFILYFNVCNLGYAT